MSNYVSMVFYKYFLSIPICVKVHIRGRYKEIWQISAIYQTFPGTRTVLNNFHVVQSS